MIFTGLDQRFKRFIQGYFKQFLESKFSNIVLRWRNGASFSLNLNGENRLYSEKEVKCDSDAGRGRHIFSAINHHESNHLQVFLVGLADAKRRH